MAESGPLSGEILGEKYLLGDLLGEGGFGAVYIGHHQLLDRLQAVKVLLEHHFRKPKFRDRFLREARTVATLDHLHIVHIDDFGVQEQTARAYLVMPFVGGGTFRDILKKHKLLSLEQVERYLEQICHALDYAHQRNVVHLDLKPLNLLVHEDGRLLLSDFGLAHFMKQQLVEGGTSLAHGSPHYMAPEHIRGQPDKCSDIYALGVILYQMLVGRHPFEGATAESIMLQHLTEQPLPLRTFRPELPLELEEVMQRALAKPMAQRYQSASDLLAAFKSILTLVRSQAQAAEEQRVRKKTEEQERIRRDLLMREHQTELERVRKEADDLVRDAEERSRKLEAQLRNAEERSQKLEELLSQHTNTLGTISEIIVSGNNGLSQRPIISGSQLRNGRYTINKVLGANEMGETFLASDIRSDGKLVFIKKLISNNADPEVLRKFKLEIQILAAIDHPQVPKMIDNFQESTHYFMVEEYVDGEDLKDRLQRLMKPMPEWEALVYTSQILDILDCLERHMPPIIHRDIKPANIVIDAKDKRAHLVDFGIARLDHVNPQLRRKQTSALGTPGYAPPEQYQGNADFRSDLYALAATLHYLLTNRDPFNYLLPLSPFPSARSLNPKLSPEIDRILTHALLINQDKRYQSALIMKHDIDDILKRGKFDNS